MRLPNPTHLARRSRTRLRRRPRPDREALLAGILDLFEEHVYVGEITPSGQYVNHSGTATFERFIGARGPTDRAAGGALWESRIHPEDWAAYQRFNRALLDGEDAEVTYRLQGLDGVTRTVWDRARPRSRADGSRLIEGVVSDISARVEVDARLAEASERFTQLLEVVGEHVYLATALPDGGVEEIFQGPGADRLLGGAEPDAEMTNWMAAVAPEDRPILEGYNRALGEGRDAEVEYRLIGADGVTRWVHDRAATRRRDDGTVEISGIVSDVTERVRLRAELDRTHAALSRVVEAMDDHLYTLRVDADGARSVYRGPNRERLAGGRLPAGGEDELWDALLHPGDRERWRDGLAHLRDGEPLQVEYRLLGLDGVQRTLLDRLRPRREADGALYYDGVTRDITERRRLEDELRRTVAEMQQAQDELERARGAAEQRARTDELTGASNRRHFVETVREALAGGAGGFGLLLLDADHFKAVNDAHGHVAGDAVLVELVGRLRSALAPGECLARWGGEEFAVLVGGVDSDAALEARAEALRTAVSSSPVRTLGAEVGLTVSVGAVLAGGERDSLDLLVEAADRCLYTAKRDGRNRVSVLAARPGARADFMARLR